MIHLTPARMAARKIGGSWWVDIRFNFVRYRKRSPLNTKGGGQAYETYLRGELAKHGSLEHLKPQPLPPAPVTFAEFAERWMRDYVAVNNKWSEQCNKRRTLRAHLLPAFGAMPLDAISSAAIERFKAERLRRRTRGREGLHPKTINNLLTILRKCLVTAVEWGELKHLPVVRFLRLGPVPYRYLTESEVDALLASVPEGPWRAMVIVALHTGLRHCELVGLQWGDVDLERQVMCVSRGKVLGRITAPKNFRSRTVPLTRASSEALAALPRSSEWIFGHVTTYWQALSALVNFSGRAGLGRVGWHDLRHTFASRLVAAGAPIKAVQDLMGHASLTMTLRYSHLGPQELRGAIDLLEPRGEEGNRWAKTSVSDGSTISQERCTTSPNRMESALQSQTTAIEAVV